MKPLLKKLRAYVFRTWEDESEPPHPRLRLLPPIFWELISYLFLLAILYKLGEYLYSLLFTQ